MNVTALTIAGNTADVPEIRFTEAGRPVARVRVAVNSRYQDTGGQWVDGPTSWHNVTAWGALAENLAESVGRGDRIVVHGRLEQRTYETESGEQRHTWEITADEIGVSLRHATAKPAKTARRSEQP